MSQFITLESAVAMTTLFRQQRENILDSNYQNQNILPYCESFDRDVFDTVLSQTGCVGLRIYYGMTEDNRLHAIVVGFDENDEDMLPGTQEFNIIEEGKRCPQECPPPSVLNGE